MICLIIGFHSFTPLCMATHRLNSFKLIHVTSMIRFTYTHNHIISVIVNHLHILFYPLTTHVRTRTHNDGIWLKLKAEIKTLHRTAIYRDKCHAQWNIKSVQRFFKTTTKKVQVKCQFVNFLQKSDTHTQPKPK